MKKTFSLTAPGKADARVRDKIRQEINNYVRRERRKKLPEGFELWTFDCKVGPTPPGAEPKPLKEIGSAIDALAQTGAAEVHVEIVAKPVQRTARR